MLCIKRVSHLLHITMIKFFKFGFLIRSSANINIYKIQMSPYYDCLIPSSSPSISARIAPVILRCFAWDRAHSFVSPLNVIFLHTRMKYSFLVFIDCTRVLCAHCNNLRFLVVRAPQPNPDGATEVRVSAKEQQTANQMHHLLLHGCVLSVNVNRMATERREYKEQRRIFFMIPKRYITDDCCWCFAWSQ